MLWKVTYLAVGAVENVVLGDQDDDRYRVAVTIVGHGDDEAPEVDAQIIYPCASCGWAGTCHGGEDCHA